LFIYVRRNVLERSCSIVSIKGDAAWKHIELPSVQSTLDVTHAQQRFNADLGWRACLIELLPHILIRQNGPPRITAMIVNTDYSELSFKATHVNAL